LCSPLIGICQAESHDFITYDTTWNLGTPGGRWNMRISRPRNLFNPSSLDTASRPVILTMPGQGEWGTTDYSKLQVYGPHYWLNNGWNGSITLGNGTHYPILITLTYVDGTTTDVANFHSVLTAILNAYHIKRNSVHIGGLSQGAFTAGAEISYEASPHDETGMKLVTSLVALEGRPDPPVTTYSWYRGDTAYGVWAKKYNGKYFTLEGSGSDNFRDTWIEAGAMNDSLPGSAYFSYENLGGGAHCCWNDMWNPSNTNWTSVGTLGPNNAPSQAGTNTMGDYQAPCNIFTWMLKQGDTSMVYGDPSTTPSLAASPSSITSLNGTAGAAGTAQTVTVTFSRTTINASAPSNTEISIDGGATYASTQSLAYSSPAGLKIRTTAGAPAGSISGNLVLSGTGVSSINIPITGTVSPSGTTPDSARFQFLITPSLLVSGWQGVIGDPSLAVLSGTISGTTVTYTTVSTSSNNWGQFYGACIGASNGVTNATIPDASNNGVMKEAVNTANLYQTTYPQFISGGWLTDGTTYDIELSGTTHYAVSAVGTYNVQGSTLNSPLSISGSGNTGSNAIWTNVSPDASGNFTFYVGKSSSSGQVGMLSYIKIKKHTTVTATPDSARFQFLITPSLLVSGWQGVIGDPSLAVLSGTISGTTITYSTVSTSSNNWGQFYGACIGANNGVTNATIPDASNSGVMREAVNTANLYQTTYPQFISGGWKTDGTTYDIELSGTTQYLVSAVGTYNVLGSTLNSSSSISGSGNTSSKATWTNVSPDAGGNFTFFAGKSSSSGQVGMLSYIKIQKHAGTGGSATNGRNLDGNAASFGVGEKNPVSLVYPNPTTGQLRVYFTSPLEKAGIVLLDAAGHVLQQRVQNGSQLEMDISAFPAGVYTLRVQQATNVFTYKVVKQ